MATAMVLHGLLSDHAARMRQLRTVDDGANAHARKAGATLSPAEIRRVAVEAGVEPRTAAKYIRGERVVSTCVDRIRRALTTLGIPDPTRARRLSLTGANAPGGRTDPRCGCSNVRRQRTDERSFPPHQCVSEAVSERFQCATLSNMQRAAVISCARSASCARAAHLQRNRRQEAHTPALPTRDRRPAIGWRTQSQRLTATGDPWGALWEGSRGDGATSRSARRTSARRVGGGAHRRRDRGGGSQRRRARPERSRKRVKRERDCNTAAASLCTQAGAPRAARVGYRPRACPARVGARRFDGGMRR